MEAQGSHPVGWRAEPWVGLALSAAVVLGWAVGHLVPDRPTYAQIFAQDWPPVAAAAATRSYQVRSAASGTPAV